jgi:hypothetical protein
METEWVILITGLSIFAVIASINECIVYVNKQAHAVRVDKLTDKSRKRVKERQRRKDAAEQVNIDNLLRGKTDSEQDSILRQYRINADNKLNQEIHAREQKEEATRRIWRNASPAELQVLWEESRKASAEERRIKTIEDDALDLEIEAQERQEKEAAKHPGNNMSISHPGQYGAKAQYSVIPSQAPLNVQVWSH